MLGLSSLSNVIDEYDLADDVNNMNNITFLALANSFFVNNWNQTLSNYSASLSNLLHRKHMHTHHSLHSSRGVGIKSHRNENDENDNNGDDGDDDDNVDDLNKERMLIFLGSLTVPGVLSTEGTILTSNQYRCT
jgi:hypothetical protein